MIHFITGHPGAGKSLLAVSLAFEYLKRGCRVASNMTLKLDGGPDPMSKVSATKLPYVVEAKFLTELGFGDVAGDWNLTGQTRERTDQDYDESKFGLLLLDECGSWLNSRDWKDKGRRELFQWLTHSRKFGWDVAIIVHDEDALDKQIKDALSDVYVVCQDLSKVKVPYLPIRLPKIHRATGFYKSKQGPVHKKWSATGKAIWPRYNTRESIRAEGHWTDEGFIDMRASYSQLTAWHLKGRYLPVKPTIEERAWSVLARVLKVVVGVPISMAAGRSPTAMLKSTPIKLSIPTQRSKLSTLSYESHTERNRYLRAKRAVAVLTAPVAGTCSL